MSLSSTITSTQQTDPSYSFSVSGRAAHGRIAPLLPKSWIDQSPYAAAPQADGVDDDDDDNDDGAYHHHQNSTTARNVSQTPDFLWENAPRFETRSYRDNARCYSHLPNGTDILDSKWVLARLLGTTKTTREEGGTAETVAAAAAAATAFNPNGDDVDDDDDKKHASLDHKSSSSSLATLETHCFRGVDGFRSFCRLVDLHRNADNQLRRIDSDDSGSSSNPPNLWVIKDAGSNGAGGIWVVGPANVERFSQEDTTPLLPEHRYVAQRYTWPMVFYEGQRKAHVRAYALFTSDGRAFLHRRSFLHVANDVFIMNDESASEEEDVSEGQVVTPSKQQDDNDDASKVGDSNREAKDHQEYKDSVHITNCCANSHDPNKFAGEICADLLLNDEHTNPSDDLTAMTTTEGLGSSSTTPVVALGPFFSSMCASVAALAEQSFSFLQGGQANNGFEYLGLDFILSYRRNPKSHKLEPVAYLLEVNAPPSQDTATGLPHAECLHDDVLRDLLSLWVIPKVTGSAEKPGGWQCVFKGDGVPEPTDGVTKPPVTTTLSKATTMNRIRWAIYERRAAREAVKRATRQLVYKQAQQIALYARTQFDYYRSTISNEPAMPVFLENAGGSQVPVQVVNAVSASLRRRHRAVIGDQSKTAARSTISTIVGASPSKYHVFLGPNASHLFSTLAQEYVRTGCLNSSDEIIISSENHVANVQPWIDAARARGAVIKWWTPTATLEEDDPSSTDPPTNIIRSKCLEDLFTAHTRLVVVPHASNIIGEVRDIRHISQTVKAHTSGRAHVVVDGVAAAPHISPSADDLDVDWYVVSCYKMFGPHLGALCGRQSSVSQLLEWNEAGFPLANPFELGTVSYEACAGVHGLGQYMAALSSFTADTVKESESKLNEPRVQSGPEAETSPTTRPESSFPLTIDKVERAFDLIRKAELPLAELLLSGLSRSSQVRVLETSGVANVGRLPVVCFLHEAVSSKTIVQLCSDGGFICRCGKFLSTKLLQNDYQLASSDHDGVVRFSMAHYNTVSEVRNLLELLESIPNWF